MSKIRRERTAEQIRMILSDLLNREVSDPRLQDLTVTRVALDRELQYADVYLNALGDDSREADVITDDRTRLDFTVPRSIETVCCLPFRRTVRIRTR